MDVKSPRQAELARTPLLQASLADRRTKALGPHPSLRAVPVTRMAATLTDRRSVIGDDAEVGEVEASENK